MSLKVDFRKPEPCRMQGAFVSLEPINQENQSEDLRVSLCGNDNTDLWTYMPFGPFEEVDALFALLDYTRDNLAWVSFAICVEGKAYGTISLMRVRQDHGSAEVGAVMFGKSLQSTSAATEAIFLLASYVFDQLGYRRFEWKCDERNMASKLAARRFGFQFEGIFRNDMIVNGENRDTVWYAMTDADWRIIKPAYDQWLSPSNFSSDGQQRRTLRSLIDQRLMGTEHSR